MVRLQPTRSPRVLVSCIALSVLAALLLAELGIFEIISVRYGVYLSVCVGLGVAVGLAGAATALVAIDVALLVTYLVICFTPIMRGPAERWVRNDAATAGKLDAVIVLSGYVKTDSGLESIAVERLLAGLELMKAGVAPRLVTTRVVRHVDGARITSDAGQKRLIELTGIHAEWTEVDSVGTTRDEATRSAALLIPVGATNVAVVTSPMHTRRACAAFEAVGFRVRCVAARESKWATAHPMEPGDRLAAFRDYFYEQLGMVKYSHKGWIK